MWLMAIINCCVFIRNETEIIYNTTLLLLLETEITYDFMFILFELYLSVPIPMCTSAQRRRFEHYMSTLQLFHIEQIS